MAGHFDDFGGDYESDDYSGEGRGSDIFCGSGHLDPAACDPATYAALQESVGFAQSTNWDSLRTPHLFMGILNSPDVGVAIWAARLNADLGKLLAQFRDLFFQDGGPAPVMLMHREFLSDNALRVLRDASARAADLGRSAFTQMDLLVTLFTMPCSIVADCFERIGVPADRLTQLALDAEQATLDV
jgi:ATP-dependent Clp protease ATP-binding subunit ClpA